MKTTQCENCEIVIIHGIAREINYCYLRDAAPELLEAAKVLIKQFGIIERTDTEISAIDWLKAAIAKAEGK